MRRKRTLMLGWIWLLLSGMPSPAVARRVPGEPAESHCGAAALCAKDARGLLGVLVLSDQHKGIGFLAVHPEARGRGVASALVRMMLDVLPADQDIFVTTYREDDPLGAAPRALYKRLGFEEAELVTRYGYPCQQSCCGAVPGTSKGRAARYARPRQAHGRAFDSAKHCANAGWSRSSFGNRWLCLPE